MSNLDIIRAWKDAEYRASLSESQREHLPDNPVGLTLSEEELAQVDGGTTSIWTTTVTFTLVPGTQTTALTTTTATTDL